MSFSARFKCITRIAARVCGVGAILLAGCASEPWRKTLTEEEFKARTEAAKADQLAAMTDASKRIIDRVTKEMEANDPSNPPDIHFLAISGGGDWGAFGSGFLVGWGEAPEGSRRPNFDVVTGVSTGALLAPFAFVNTDESCARVDNFYRNPASDWVESRGMFFFLPSNSSFMVIPNLEKAVGVAMDKEMIEQVAANARDGKILAVSATDLDLGMQHFWNLGTAAEQAEKTGDFERVRRMMLASAAIPVAFPPVEIDGVLYADGGVTANVFLRLDPRSPAGIIQTWKRTRPGKPLPKVRFWIILNNQTTQTPSTVQRRWPAILGPSIPTSIRSATLSEIRWIAAQADFINATMNADIEVRMVSIPDAWRVPVPGDFKDETMRALSDLGRKMGADPASWQLLASPATVRDLRSQVVPELDAPVMK